jgi:tetratricopeptide (TPR) repeat protein
MNYLALTLRDLGRHQEALVINEQVLELRKRILGAEHPVTLLSMNNLALTLRDLGRHEEALVMNEQVLELEKRILGAEHS